MNQLGHHALVWASAWVGLGIHPSSYLPAKGHHRTTCSSRVWLLMTTPTNETTPFTFLGAREQLRYFGPRAEPYLTVSLGVRGRETSCSRFRADVRNVGEGRESKWGLPGRQWGNCQRHSGTDTAQGGDRGPDQSQL